MVATTAGSEIERLIVLGASNVRRGLTQLIEAGREVHPSLREVWIAAGHGRSYGGPSSIPGRTLPGIIQCRLWADLDSAKPLPTQALLTDIGNDLLYEVPVETIARWVNDCCERLSRHRAQLVITLLPAQNLAQLSTWRYKFFKNLFFPKCRLSLAQLGVRVHQLNDLLVQVATHHSAVIAEFDPAWYAFDPIHPRLQLLHRIWSQFLNHSAIPERFAQLPRGERMRMALRAPAERKLLGLTMKRAQPCFKVMKGPSIALY